MYLNVVQLAESFGVDESVVEGWVRHEALPHVPDRGRLLFDRAQVVAWAASRGLAARAGFLAAERSTAGAARQLGPLLRAGGIWRDVAVADVAGVLEQIVGRLPGLTPAIRQLLVQRLRLPGGVTWAPVGGGLALPHLRSPAALGREAGVLALLFLREALPLSEPIPDAEPVVRLLFFIAPSPRAHLDLLGQLSRALRGGELHRLIVEGAADDRILAAVAAAEGPAAALAPEEGP